MPSLKITTFGHPNYPRHCRDSAGSDKSCGVTEVGFAHPSHPGTHQGKCLSVGTRPSQWGSEALVRGSQG